MFFVSVCAVYINSENVIFLRYSQPSLTFYGPKDPLTPWHCLNAQKTPKHTYNIFRICLNIFVVSLLNCQRHYQNRKFLPVWEVSIHSGSFCLPVLVNIIETYVDEAVLDFSFGKNQMNASFWLPVWEVFMLSPLRHEFHAVKDKTMRWKTFKLWCLSI